MKPVRFYCEFCGHQVRPGDKICPHCGSFFSQVRCPSCGFEGEAKQFLTGCPVCGFLGTEADLPAAKAGKKTADIQDKKKKGNYQVLFTIHEKKRSSVPTWVFLLFGALLIAVIAIAIIAVPKSS